MTRPDREALMQAVRTIRLVWKAHLETIGEDAAFSLEDAAATVEAFVAQIDKELAVLAAQLDWHAPVIDRQQWKGGP